MPEYPLPDLVYRAMKKKWIENGKVISEAYFRRADEAGPSVGTSKKAAVENLKNIRFVANLRIVDIHAIINPMTQKPLRVVLDRPDHGEIMGLPLRGESLQASQAAEFVAGELARQSVLEANE